MSQVEIHVLQMILNLKLQRFNIGMTVLHKSCSPRSSVSGKKKVGIGANMPALRGLETDG